VAAYASVVACTRLTFAPIDTDAARDLAVSKNTIGWLALVFPLLYVLLALPAGIALDRCTANHRCTANQWCDHRVSVAAYPRFAIGGLRGIPDAQRCYRRLDPDIASEARSDLDEASGKDATVPPGRRHGRGRQRRRDRVSPARRARSMGDDPW
jgi:hypothetical protein